MRRVLLLPILLLALAGCGEDEAEEISGTGYSYEVPGGWEDVSDDAEFEAAGFNSDSVVRGESSEGFASNINVVRETSLASDIDIDEYTEAGLRLLKEPELLTGEAREIFEGIDAKDFSDTTKVELDGADARSTDYSSEQGGRSLRLRVVSAIDDDTAYNITFTALRSHFEDDVEALDEIVDSWRWR